MNCCCDGGGDADSRAGLRPKAGVAWGVEAGVWPGVTAPPAASNCWMWCVGLVAEVLAVGLRGAAS